MAAKKKTTLTKLKHYIKEKTENRRSERKKWKEKTTDVIQIHQKFFEFSFFKIFPWILIGKIFFQLLNCFFNDTVSSLMSYFLDKFYMKSCASKNEKLSMVVLYFLPKNFPSTNCFTWFLDDFLKRERTDTTGQEEGSRRRE